MDNPDAITVIEEVDAEGTILVKLAAAQEDMGRIIGKQGRTAKAMRSSLAGIPIVSPAWLHACVGEQRAMQPFEAMCATGLPTKNDIIQSTGESHWGVARMATSLRQGGSLPLQDIHVAVG